MNAKQQAAADLKRFAVGFRGILGIADDLDTVGSLEQQEGELKARIGKLKTEADKEGKALEEAKVKTEAAKKQAKELLDGAKADADKAREQANADAEGIRAAAQTEADRIAHESGAKLAAVNKQIDEANAKLASLVRETKAAESARDAAQEQLNVLKRKFA